MHYYRQLTAREMLMERDTPAFAVAELVGGLLDGKRFRRQDGDASTWFESDRRCRYELRGESYRPTHVRKGVLYLAHVPKRAKR